MDGVRDGWKDESARWAADFEADMRRIDEAAREKEAIVRRLAWRDGFATTTEGLRWMTH